MSQTNTRQQVTWSQVADVAKTAKNVRVVGAALVGNDGLILTQNAYIALGYAKSDWDAVNCKAGR